MNSTIRRERQGGKTDLVKGTAPAELHTPPEIEKHRRPHYSKATTSTVTQEAGRHPGSALAIGPTASADLKNMAF
jgi:hypothetical protein